MKAVLSVSLLLLLSSIVLAGRPIDRVRVDGSYPAAVLQSNGIAATKADTVTIFGGPLLGNGDFERDGMADWDGWVGIDMTARTVSYWHIDTFNSPTGTNAVWCGDVYESCGGADTPEGYGNSYEEYLVWTGRVSDPELETNVVVSFDLNYDSEPGYDYLYVQYEYVGGMTTVVAFNGIDGPIFETHSFTVLPADYVGDDLDEIHLRLLAVSDGAWSDEDCLWPTSGLAQVDNISVSGDNGLVSTFDDFEDGLENSAWSVAFPVSVGDFSKVWPLLDDIDPCVQNNTPQVAFIDDGVVVPCTGGSLGVSWTYGPGGYVHNLRGGCAGPSFRTSNYIWSPPIAWVNPQSGYSLGSTHQGAVLEFDVYPHLPIGNFLLYDWSTRVSDDGGNEWSEWNNHNYYYYGQGRYRRDHHDITGLFSTEPTHIQISLGIYQGWWWPMEVDGTPAPYFDNVALKIYQINGPTITANEHELAQDSFPSSGNIDLIDLGANSIRFDMAYDINGRDFPAILPGDSLVFTVTAGRKGSVLAENPRLYYTLDPNPMFNAYRLHPTDGFVEGDTVSTQLGEVVPGQWCFDLPDEDFFYPGDVIHYFVSAKDDIDGHVRTTTLPQSLTGFSLFPGAPDYIPLQWPSSFTVHGLPSLFSESPGDQPPVLLFNDYGGGGGEDEWMSSLRNLGYVEGVDYDVYYVNAPSSGVGNGLGARATLAQISGYSTMIYTCGDLTSYTLNSFNQNRDKSNDLGLLDAWLQTEKNLLLTGDGLVMGMISDYGTAGDDFVSTWLSVTYVSSSISDLYYDQQMLGFIPVSGNSLGIDIPLYADGNCPSLNSFDAVLPDGDVEVLLEWEGYSGTEAAGFLNTHLGSRVAYFPIDFTFMNTPVGSGDGTAARTHLLEQVLTAFGESPTGSSTAVEPQIPLVLSVSAHPNPFNPATTIKYAVSTQGEVSVNVYNVRGELVRALVGDHHEPGIYTIAWDGFDDRGMGSASGVYFVQVATEAGVVVSKLALLK